MGHFSNYGKAREAAPGETQGFLSPRWGWLGCAGCLGCGAFSCHCQSPQAVLDKHVRFFGKTLCPKMCILCQQLSDGTSVTHLHGASGHGVPAMGSRSPRALGSRMAPWQASGFAFTLVIAGEENPRVPVAEGWMVSSCSQRPETTGQRAGRSARV